VVAAPDHEALTTGDGAATVSGTSAPRFAAEEIAGPLGADFHVGLAARHDARVARVIPPDEVLVSGDADSLVVRIMNRMGEGTLGDACAAGLVMAAYESLAG
jgi:hypothetical protein